MTRIQQEQALTTPSPFLFSKTTDPVGFWTTHKRSMPGCSFNFRTGMELTPDRQFTAHKFGSFVHATQALVSRAAVVGQNLFVYACPIIANFALAVGARHSGSPLRSAAPARAGRRCAVPRRQCGTLRRAVWGEDPAERLAPQRQIRESSGSFGRPQALHRGLSGPRRDRWSL